jgi:hypothetical protein
MANELIKSHYGRDPSKKQLDELYAKLDIHGLSKTSMFGLFGESGKK